MNAAKLRGELDSAGLSVCEDLAACAFVSIDCQSISSWCACGAINSPTTRVIVSLEPVPSLVCHPRMVADYMADQIEQSAPLQGLFQEVTQFMDTYEQASLEGTPAIQGFRLSCSGRLQKQKILEARRNGRNNDPNSRSSSLKLLQATNPICANSSYQCVWNVWNQSVNQLRRAKLIYGELWNEGDLARSILVQRRISLSSAKA